MKEKWNQRYSAETYAYGTAPNEFFRQALQAHPLQGKFLLPAEGEGRNAVFAAQQGLEVTAFDQSEAGQQKALQLAAVHQVEINYLVGDMADMQFEEASFDGLGLIYAHFPAERKSAFHRELARYLKKGGLLFFEAFSKKHLPYVQQNPAVGGPRDLETLFSIEELQHDFAGFTFLQMEEVEVELNEGLYHKGLGSVVRMIARK